MSARELPHRVREQLRRRSDRLRHPDTAPPGALPRWPATVVLDDGCRAALEEARRQVLSVPFAERTAWHVDPVTQQPWPTDAWPPLRRLGRDPKPTWELHRLQHLQVLATAGDETALRDLDAWLDENPPWRGLGWGSGLEVACRVVTLLRVADGLRSGLGGAEQRIRDALLAHGTWLERHPSLYSSANNHRLAEAAALVLLGATTDLPPASRWLSLGRRAVAEVLPSLIFADGVGGEMSVGYQAFAMEWALVARLGSPLGTAVDERLAVGAAHLCKLLDRGGHAPAIGDADDGVVLRQVTPEPAYVCSVAGAVGAALGRRDLVPPGWRPDLRARVLGLPEVSGRARPGGRSYPIGGLTVLRSRRLHVTVDHGPLGWPALAAHGHADALALWVSADGQPLLVGCGTYRYLGAPGWRAWLRGTAAHNTVVVGGLDSSEQSDDPFLWRSRARCRLEAVHLSAEGGEVRASHDGYVRRLGVVHRRTVRLDGHVLTVTDRLEGVGSQRVVVPFHFRPGLDVRGVGAGVWTIAAEKQVARLTADLDGAVVVRQPSEGPGPGVRAPRYGALVPAPTLWLTATVSLPWAHTWQLSLR